MQSEHCLTVQQWAMSPPPPIPFQVPSLTTPSTGMLRLLHCTENLNHIFPEIKLLSLVPNFYIPTIRSWEYINRSQIHYSGNWEKEHYISVLEIRGRTVSFLGIYKLEPDNYIRFLLALHLQCQILPYEERTIISRCFYYVK